MQSFPLARGRAGTIVGKWVVEPTPALVAGKRSFLPIPSELRRTRWSCRITSLFGFGVGEMKRLVVPAVLSMVVCGSSAGNATTIDFESATTGTCQVVNGGSVDGFTLNNGGYNTAAACLPFLSILTANSGEKYMLNYNSLVSEFTKNDGIFTLNNLFVHANVGSTTVRFQGLDAIGGNILHTIDIGIGAAWQQVFFIDWSGIKTFTWDPLIPDVRNIAIDDFTYVADVAPVPIPSALQLLSGGLAIMGFLGWRRSRQLIA